MRAAILAWLCHHKLSVAGYATPSIGKNIVKTVIKGVKEVALYHTILCLVKRVINQVIVSKGLLVRLLELLTNVLAIHKSVFVGLPRIVQIRVEVEELTPSQIDVVDLLVHLLTHVDEVLSGHRVVNHGDTTCLFVALGREECTFLTQVVDLLARIRQHEAKGSLSVVK